MHHPLDRLAHTTAFVTPVVEHWLERDIAQRATYREREKLTEERGQTEKHRDR